MSQRIGPGHGQDGSATLEGRLPRRNNVVYPHRLDTSNLEAGAAKQKPKQVVAWRDLPKKPQLTVITLARLSEPLVQTSFHAYMFYQLKWFDSSLPDSVIATQAGIVNGSFTAAQFLTAMLWGVVADNPRFGRKTVILIGLFGTMISSLGFGLSRNFWTALCFRSLGGITNGNVGVMRTMINEMIQDKKYQSRAFLLLPLCFNIGVVIGPMLGGALSDPLGVAFDPDATSDRFLARYPYALPNMVGASFVCAALIMTWLLLEETHEHARDKRDIGRMVGKNLTSFFRRRRTQDYKYMPLSGVDSPDAELSPIDSLDSLDSGPKAMRHSADEQRQQPSSSRRRYTQVLPYRRIFTTNLCLTFLAHFFLAFSIGTFNSLWFVFLSTPVYDPSSSLPSPTYTPKLPFRFTGGLGLQPQQVGPAMSILGIIGITLQLLVYPRVTSLWGNVRCWRYAIRLFPLVFFVMPYLSLVPSSSSPQNHQPDDGGHHRPTGKTGPAIWFALCGILTLQVLGRTFAMPTMTILVNNAAPHPSVLGTVHGLGQSVSTLAKTVGPVLGGYLYGVGLERGYVGAVFWGLAGVSVIGALVSLWVREGDGHDIWLEGDLEEEDEGSNNART